MSVRRRAPRQQRGFIINPYQIAAASDPFFANVSLLLHMDDLAPLDYSQYHHGASKTGTSRSGTQSKFGGFSFQFANTGGLDFAAHTAFDYGTGDFTDEYWWYPTGTDFGFLRESANSPAGAVAGVFTQFVTATRTINAGQAYGTQIITGTIALTLNTWNHVALTRLGTLWTLWINGVQDTTGTSAANLTASGRAYVGGTFRALSDSPVGYLDEVRFTKGVARYTAAFTPPTTAFPNS